MADEITITPSVSLSNGRLIDSYSPGSFKVTQTNGRMWQQAKNIGTTEESVTSFGDITTPGVVMLLNLDDTNYVEWGFATGDYDGHMTANDGTTTKGLPWAIFYGVSGLTLYLKANTAACDVLITVYDR